MMYTERIIEFFKDNGYSAEVIQCYKGGVKKNAVVIKNDKNICPQMIVNDEEISRLGLEAYCNKMLEAFKGIKQSDISDISDIAEKIKEFEFVKDKIFVQLRPKTDDKKALKRDFLDLEEIVRIDLGSASAVVSSELLDSLYKVSKEDLFEIAEKNTEKMVQLFNMADYFLAKIATNSENDIDIDINDSLKLLDDNLYVITNKDERMGAGIICCSNIMDKLLKASSKKRLIVLPSSIHEVIIVNYKDAENYSIDKLLELTDMVMHVNSEVVDDVDILSNSLYVYNGNNNWNIIKK